METVSNVIQLEWIFYFSERRNHAFIYNCYYNTNNLARHIMCSSFLKQFQEILRIKTTLQNRQYFNNDPKYPPRIRRGDTFLLENPNR
jgi:hypothetical protein